MVRLGNLNPNNWAGLLVFLEDLRAGHVGSETPAIEVSRANSPHEGTSLHAARRAAVSCPEADQSPASDGLITQIRHPELRPASNEQCQQVLDLYQAGHPIAEITDRVGVARSSVHRICRRAGLLPRVRGSEDLRQQARSLRRQGWAVTRISDDLGFSTTTIRRWLAAGDEI